MILIRKEFCDMSNDSVHGNDANSQIGRGQGHHAIRDERSMEEQLQELRAMMANLTTQIG